MLETSSNARSIPLALHRPIALINWEGIYRHSKHDCARWEWTWLLIFAVTEQRTFCCRQFLLNHQLNGMIYLLRNQARSNITNTFHCMKQFVGRRFDSPDVQYGKRYFFLTFLSLFLVLCWILMKNCFLSFISCLLHYLHYLVRQFDVSCLILLFLWFLELNRAPFKAGKLSNGGVGFLVQYNNEDILVSAEVKLKTSPMYTQWLSDSFIAHFSLYYLLQLLFPIPFKIINPLHPAAFVLIGVLILVYVIVSSIFSSLILIYGSLSIHISFSIPHCFTLWFFFFKPPFFYIH